MTSAIAYGRMASVFVESIREVSPYAADCLEQLGASLGNSVAYHAAFALIILKEREIVYQQAPTYRDLTDFTVYQEIQGHVEALDLYEDAARHFLTGLSDLDGEMNS